MASNDFPAINLNNHLKCQVCSNLSVSPIYTCQNGHVVCGICYDTLSVKLCRCCLTRLTKNGFIERIFTKERIRLPCRNGGCPVKSKPSDMRTHLTECDFRSIRCVEESGTTCTQRMYCPYELFEHWKDYHKITKLQVKPASTSAYSGSICSVSQNQLILKDSNDCRCRISYFEVEGQLFFLHVVCKSELVHFWVTRLGSEASDIRFEKYTCRISLLESPLKFPAGTLITWKFPIHSIQHYALDTIKALGHVGILYTNTLKMPGTVMPNHWTFMNIRIDVFKN